MSGPQTREGPERTLVQVSPIPHSPEPAGGPQGPTPAGEEGSPTPFLQTKQHSPPRPAPPALLPRVAPAGRRCTCWGGRCRSPSGQDRPGRGLNKGESALHNLGLTPCRSPGVSAS